MPKKAKTNNTNNLKIGLVFALIIAALVFFSLLGKLFFVLKQSRYDSNYPFYLEVYSGNKAQALAIFTKENRISVLNINDTGVFLPIPMDSKIAGNVSNIDSNNVSTFFISLLSNGNIKTNLTVFDILRLYLFTKTVGAGDIRIEEFPLSADAAHQDKLIYSLFSDSGIVSDGLRIEVSNATGGYGIGNRAARMLSDIGANVIFVSTADNTQAHSLIYYFGDKNYTIERLSRLFDFDVIRSEEKSIADVKLQIGQDNLVKFK